MSLITPAPSVLSECIKSIGATTPITSETEMVEFLDALLEQAIDGFKVPETTLVGPTGPGFKWRYSSAFQKAVRRNDPSVRKVAVALNACDPAYIWRRAPAIALEDVSLGDPWVCALVLHSCRFARVRRKFGNNRLAGFLGTLMGSAVKDRLSCDSFCLAYMHPELAEVRKSADAMSPVQRAELYQSDDTPYASRIAAGLTLAGPRYGGDVFTGAGGSPAQLAEIVEGLVPFPIAWISRQYSKMCRDGMFVAFPLVWRQLVTEGKTRIVKSKLPSRTVIDGVLSATFDGYTAEGRRAFSYFAKSCEPVAKFLAHSPVKHKQVALAVFTEDSSLLDRRLSSPWGKALYRENLRGEVLAAGMSLEQFSELAELVVQNLDLLNDARLRVTR